MMNPHVALFWDYDKIPMNSTDWEGFRRGLTNYSRTHSIAIGKVYYRKSRLTDIDRDIFERFTQMNFILINREEPFNKNENMPKDCIELLKKDKNIKEILLFSSDDDFISLYKELKKKSIPLLYIHRHDVHPESIDINIRSDQMYEFSFIAQNYQNWWFPDDHPQSPRYLNNKAKEISNLSYGTINEATLDILLNYLDNEYDLIKIRAMESLSKIIIYHYQERILSNYFSKIRLAYERLKYQNNDNNEMLGYIEKYLGDVLTKYESISIRNLAASNDPYAFEKILEFFQRKDSESQDVAISAWAELGDKRALSYIEPLYNQLQAQSILYLRKKKTIPRELDDRTYFIGTKLSELKERIKSLSN